MEFCVNDYLKFLPDMEKYMSKFDEFDHYRISDDDFDKRDKQSYERNRKFDDFEDISSDYRPEEKKTNGSSYQQTERKFFDDSLLQRRNDPEKYLENQRYNQQRAAKPEQNNNFSVNDFGKGHSARNPNTQYEDFNSGLSDSGAFYLGNNQKRGNNYQADDYYQQNRRVQREMYPNANDTRNRNPYGDEYEDYNTDGRQGGSKGKKNKGGKKKKNLAKIVIIAILVLVLLGAGGAYAAFHGMFNSLNNGTPIDENNIGVSDAIKQKYGNQNIINIALFGIDTREEDSFEGRSDSIMIVSVNVKTGEIKLISILRDSFVEIEGHKPQKITHAYQYGGAELAIKTINQNFDMNITDYATINFFKMGDVIDAFGGLDIEINDMEMDFINGLGNSEGRKVELITKTGLVHLNGAQAVSYARIREDGDDKRAERQRLVLNLILEKARKMSVTKYPSLVKSLMKMVETSMSSSEILGLAPIALKNIQISQTVMPDEKYDKPKEGKRDGQWVWIYDLEKASDRIHKFIYEDGATAKTEPAEEPKTTTTKSKKN